MLSWGANSYGQLGLGFISEMCQFPTEAVLSHEIEDVISIAAGGGHSLLLDSAGTLFGSGSNKYGQLGELANNTLEFSKLNALQDFKIIRIKCGWESSFAITEDGSLLAWGSNKFGQLGISKDKVTTTNQPIVKDGFSVSEVAAGLRHTAVISGDRHVYTCGSSRHGQLGVDLADGPVPSGDCDCFVKVNGLEDVVQVACGQHHTLALTGDGRLYGWGDNRRGQLIPSGPISLPTPELLMTCDPGSIIKAGWTHSALVSGGHVTTWGRNNYGQLGHSSSEASGPSQVSNLSRVTQLELGAEHNLALLDNGEIWSWGWNEHGNCGSGTVEDLVHPQRIPTPYTIQLITTGGGHSIALPQN